ncbi:MAG TPA: DUF4214 domain-containing protein [Pyrinomonadaceae bacterium]|nr:DUF4214 domain-containing protein [Pyrinomonadaceae bacterium]
MSRRVGESRLWRAARALARAAAARPLARELGVFAAFALLTVVMTWPWARHWRDTVAGLGDPYIIAYTLWWDYHATFNQPAGLFDATIFYPYRDTLAFSEHDYGIALLFFPLFAAGVAPLTVHSLATLLAFAFSGYGAFRLARTLTGSTAAAVVAGIAFAFVPYRFHRLPHLHYVFAGWLPLAFEAVVLFVRRRSWRRAAWLGAAFTMNALTCVTWFVLGLIPLALAGALLVLWERAWRDRRLWLRGGPALALSAVLLFPFLLPYRRVAAEHGFVRTAGEAAGYSATLGHWFAASARNKLWEGFGRDAAGEEMALFPGLLAPVLALASLLFFTGRGRRRDGGADAARDAGAAGDADEYVSRGRAFRGSRRGRWLTAVLALLDAAAVASILSALLGATYGANGVELFGMKLPQASHYGRALVLTALALTLRWVLARTDLFRVLKSRGLAAFALPGAHGQGVLLALAWVVPGFLGSLGMNFFFHRLLFEHVEAFRAVRVPARWAMIAYVGLAVLAGLGARQLAEVFARRNGRLGKTAVAGLLAALLVAELWAAPLAVIRGQARPDALTLRLKETPMRGGIVQLPVFGMGGQTFEHMLRAADHGKPLVTATSSFHPPLVARIHALSQQRPVPFGLLDVLESVPASYLVLDYSQMSLEEIDALRPLVRHALDAGRLRFCGRFDDRGLKDLFAVVGTEPDARAAGEYAPPRVRLNLAEEPGQGTVVGLSLTPEVAEGGPMLFRFYRASYGRAPTYVEFRRDLPLLVAGVGFESEGWRQRLAESAERFAAGWVGREEFAKRYGAASDTQYVSALAANAGRGIFDGARLGQLAAELSEGSETRAGALLRVVGDEGFARRESDAAFVTLHYFSFLERDPDPAGFEAWLRALARVDRAAFTRSFTASIEYQNKRNAPR